MIKRIGGLVCLSMFTVGLSLFPARVRYGEGKSVLLVKTIETRNCFISYITIDGVLHLVKQKKDPKKQINVVRDALAAYIAETLNIAHGVDIVPFKHKFPGKINASWPATLHTIAPGETVRVQKSSKYNGLRLRQLWSRVKDFNQKGLTPVIINYMTWHKHLPLIIALDLITGNTDRHCGNLCYEPITDKFCAIDMDDTFNKDLCLLACKKLETMMRDDQIIFSKKEIRALKDMKETLQLLLRKHRPQELIAKLHLFAKKAGFVQGSKIYTPSVTKKLHLYEQMIGESYASARKLIALLDIIIARKYRIMINNRDV